MPIIQYDITYMYLISYLCVSAVVESTSITKLDAVFVTLTSSVSVTKKYEKCDEEAKKHNQNFKKLSSSKIFFSNQKIKFCCFI